MRQKTIGMDVLIDMFQKLSETPVEMGEQEETGGGAKSPTKHFDLYQPVRGAANQIGNTKWSDSYTLKRGVGNTLF